MSGNVAEPIGEAELTKQVMEKFKVGEKTAEQIINFAVYMAIERMEKWTKNHRKLQKQKAEEIYILTKKIKMADLTVMGLPRYCKVVNDLVDEIEKKILELCVNNE